MPNEEASREAFSSGPRRGSDGDDDASLSDGGRSGKGDERKERREKARELARRRRRRPRRNASKFSSAATPRRSRVRCRRRGPRRPPRRAVPSGRRPLAHVHRAHVASPKIAALVADLRDISQAGRRAKPSCSRSRATPPFAPPRRSPGRASGALADGNAATPASATLARRKAARPDAAARAVARSATTSRPRAAAARGLRRRRLDADARGPGDPAGCPEPGRRGASRDRVHCIGRRARCGAHVLRAGHGRGAPRAFRTGRLFGAGRLRRHRRRSHGAAGVGGGRGRFVRGGARGDSRRRRRSPPACRARSSTACGSFSACRSWRGERRRERVGRRAGGRRRDGGAVFFCFKRRSSTVNAYCASPDISLSSTLCHSPSHLHHAPCLTPTTGVCVVACPRCGRAPHDGHRRALLANQASSLLSSGW